MVKLAFCPTLDDHIAYNIARQLYALGGNSDELVSVTV